jgi:hypothetical protein
MTRWTTLDEFYGLLDLMLTGEEEGPNFILCDVACTVVPSLGRHGSFEAVGEAFALMLVLPGWYVGEHGVPVHILIVGDVQACMDWLPITRADKCAYRAPAPRQVRQDAAHAGGVATPAEDAGSDTRR